MTSSTITGRQRALLRWYRAHGRHALPWRHAITPYRILVSEIMLQQTQVDRVIPYFVRWMKRWPTVDHLARAKRASVIRAWSGLGYNRRAVCLHRAAQEIVVNGWPDVGAARRGRPSGRAGTLLRATLRKGAAAPRPYDVTALAKRLEILPGIGPYTANAILAFAWNLPAPCVDVNVRRVLAYAIYKRPAIMKMSLTQVERLAVRVIPPGQGRAWNSALMDYGALMLQAHDVPKRNRPRPPQSTFANSTRFWRGRIVAVLRDAPQHGVAVEHLRVALARYGIPPSLASLLTTLARDGMIVQRDMRYHLA